MIHHRKTNAAALGTICLTGLSFAFEASGGEPQVIPENPRSIAASPQVKKERLEKGDKLPEFKAKDLSGKEVDILKFGENKLVLITFWGPWCPGCLKELNEPNNHLLPVKLKNVVIVDPQSKSGEKIAQGFVSIAISANWDQAQQGSWMKMARSNPFLSNSVNLEVFQEDKIFKAQKEYAYSAYPTWILADGQGRVLFSSSITEPAPTNEGVVLVTKQIHQIPDLLIKGRFLPENKR